MANGIERKCMLNYLKKYPDDYIQKIGKEMEAWMKELKRNAYHFEQELVKRGLVPAKVKGITVQEDDDDENSEN